MSWWEIQVYGESALEDLIFWRLEVFGCRGTSSQNQGESLRDAFSPGDTLRFAAGGRHERRSGSSELAELPSGGLTQNIRTLAYLPQNQADESDLAALSQLLRQDALNLELAAPEVQWTLVDEEDWANSWKQYWQPQKIGDRFLIYPAWLEIPQVSDRQLLRLDPGVAFGTGAHATTQLCLEAVEQQLGSSSESHPIVADIGCGSGILSIGAALLGASRVYAVDTDPLAVQSTQSNRDLNQIDPSRIVAEQGSIERLIELIECPVDGILCNILAEVIISLVPQMNALSKPTTWGILSGILVKEAEQVIDVLMHHGWIVSSLRQQQDWCCLNIRRA